MTIADHVLDPAFRIETGYYADGYASFYNTILDNEWNCNSPFLHSDEGGNLDSDGSCAFQGTITGLDPVWATTAGRR